MNDTFKVEILGDGWFLFCRWCKATQPYIPQSCGHCFETQSLPLSDKEVKK